MVGGDAELADPQGRSARDYAVFGSGSSGPPGPTGPIVDAIRAFYRDRSAWLVLLATALVLCYGDGLLMFWYHSVALGEGGPAIAWYSHWLLDSSFAFVALTPVLVLIVPLGAMAADRLVGRRVPGANSRARRAPWVYVGVTGGLFTLVTTPGPIAHDLLVGRGTWVAARVTALVGDPSAPLAPVLDYPPPVAMAQQLAAGLPTYLAGSAISLLLVRVLLRRTRPRAA